MPSVKNGTSRYDIKEWLITEVSPKYFSKVKNMSDLNVGLFGYINDILGETTKDAFFSISSLYKEIFPQLAELPESIYNHALLYQLNNVFAVPAKCYFTLVIAEDIIINNGTISAGFTYFDIDSGMSFVIDGKNFMLDYDIRITTKKTSNGFIHSAQYIMDPLNSLSDLTNPYILTGIYIGENKKRYVSLQVQLHQVSKRTIENTITSNDTINAVTMEYPFDNQLANFEIFYRAPGSGSFVQLKKLLENTFKLEDPFCFYSLSNDNLLKISFTNDEHYFQPEYSSDIIIQLYTTLGKDGNFEQYDGTSIRVVGSYDKYESNRGVVFMGNVIGSAENGSDRMTIDELQNETVKSYSTVKSFTTTSDLQIYFNEVMQKANEKTRVLFMKKRDDVYERLYCSFILFKDDDNNIIPTNTLDLLIKPEDVDYNLSLTSRNVVNAGKIYEYIEDAEDPYARIKKGYTYESDLDEFENSSNDFIYMNPFLMIMGTNPLDVGFYINTISSNLPVDYLEVNSDSFYQFVIDTIQIDRNALDGGFEELTNEEIITKFGLKFDSLGNILEESTYIYDDSLEIVTYSFTIPEDLIITQEHTSAKRIELQQKQLKEFYHNYIERKKKEYEITVQLSPIASLEEEPFVLKQDDTSTDGVKVFKNIYDGYEYIDSGDLKIVLEFIGLKNNRCMFTVMNLVGFDEEFYTFKGRIYTNDYISTKQELQITGGIYDSETMEYDVRNMVLIPSIDAQIIIHVLYRYPDKKVIGSNEFTRYKGFEEYTLTNKYRINQSNLANFVIPVKEIKSYVEYVTKIEEGKYTFRLERVPLVKANYIKIKEARDKFFSSMQNIYKYLEVAMNQLPNNYNIDLKFFNTYGRSEHYYLVDSETKIDKPNISLTYNAKFDVIDPELLVEDLKKFIKEKIESEKITLTKSPSFYSSAVVAACFDKFPNLVYLDLFKINHYGTEIQSLESDVNESNILQELISTDDIIPEYLNIDHIISKGVKSPQIFINVLH